MTRIVAALLLAAGCAKSPAKTAPEPSGSSTGGSSVAKTVADAPAAAPDAPAAAACTEEGAKKVAEARGNAMRMFIAMDSGGPLRAAQEAWVSTDPACRDGRWYYVAALILSFASSGGLEAPGVKIATIDDALTAALGKPDDIDVLARVAYNAHLGRQPALPKDACDRAKAVGGKDADRIAYVCGHAALAGGDGKAAMEQFAAVHQRFSFLDLDLAAAEAAKLAGDKTAMKAFAKAAGKANYDAANKAYVSGGDAKLVVAAAKKLL